MSEKKREYFYDIIMKDAISVGIGVVDNNIIDEIDNKRVNKDYKITPKEDDLYSFVRLEDINKLNELSNLKRIKIWIFSSS